MKPWFDQYCFTKIFGAGKPYGEHTAEEVDMLLLIEQEINAETERKQKIREAQSKAKGGKYASRGRHH